MCEALPQLQTQQIHQRQSNNQAAANTIAYITVDNTAVCSITATHPDLANICFLLYHILAHNNIQIPLWNMQYRDKAQWHPMHWYMQTVVSLEMYKLARQKLKLNKHRGTCNPNTLELCSQINQTSCERVNIKLTHQNNGLSNKVGRLSHFLDDEKPTL